eukprot:161264_1
MPTIGKSASMSPSKLSKMTKLFFDQAQTEVNILEHLAKVDSSDEETHIVKMKEVFVHEGHRCIVFELLDNNLYHILKNHRFKGLSLNVVRKIGAQILVALNFLRKHHPNGVIHCDLKPENVLLLNNKHTRVRVIDFGSACFKTKTTFAYIQSRFYRAPEVLLDTDYSYPIDMWSLGCMLMELYTGDPLFDGVSDDDQMYKIVGVLSMPPAHILADAPGSSRFFRFEGGQYVMKSQPQEQGLPESCLLKN